MTHFNTPLGVTGSVYDWGAPYDDGSAMKVIGSLPSESTIRRGHRCQASTTERCSNCSIADGRSKLAGRHANRGYASVLRIVELPFRNPHLCVSRRRLQSVEQFIARCTRPLGRRSFAIERHRSRPFRRSQSSRSGSWSQNVVSNRAVGYPAVQFDTRHFFFLEFIPWLALGLTCEGARRPGRGDVLERYSGRTS